MCNIYKNNLTLLSQIEEGQFIYYDSNYSLNYEDRYLSYIRKGTQEKKISDIIKNSYLKILNTYVINLVSQENNSDTEKNISENDMIEIENTKHILRKSLAGIENYLKTLEINNYESTNLKNTYNILKEIFDNLENHKSDYLIKINNSVENSQPINSKSWLYSLYESTIKSEPKPINQNEGGSNLQIETETLLETQLETQLENHNNDDLEIQDEKNTLTCNKTEEDTENNSNSDMNCEIPECVNEETCENTTNYVQGILYIITRKITNFFFVISKHVTYYF